MEKGIVLKNTLCAVIWIVSLLIAGGAVAFMVYAEVGQYYDVLRYLIWEGVATLLTIGLAWLWLHLATTTSGWIVTQTCLSALLFIVIAIAIAAGSYAICHLVYTPDGRNWLELTAVFILPATFAALMYAFPPLQIEPEILPGGGIGQIVVRWLIFFMMSGVIVWLFLSNF